MCEQVGDELHRAGIGPLHVIEHEHDRRVLRDRGQQRSDRAVGAVALFLLQLGRALGDQRPEGREHGRKLRLQPGAQRDETVAVKRRQPSVQRVAEHAERGLGLELGRPPGQHEVTMVPRLRRQLVEKPALADARLSGDLQHQRAVGRVQPVEQLRKRLQLALPANQRLHLELHANPYPPKNGIAALDTGAPISRRVDPTLPAHDSGAGVSINPGVGSASQARAVRPTPRHRPRRRTGVVPGPR